MFHKSKERNNKIARFQLSLIIVLLGVYSLFSLQFKVSDIQPIILSQEHSGPLIHIPITEKKKIKQKKIIIKDPSRFKIVKTLVKIDTSINKSNNEVEIAIINPFATYNYKRVKASKETNIPILKDRNSSYPNMNDFLLERLHFDTEAYEDGIEYFTVKISFTVERDGSLSNIILDEGESDYDFADQVLEAIKSMDNWKAKIENGDYTSIRLQIPIIFTTDLEVH